MKASIINNTLIRLFTMPKGLYRSLGVDTGHLTTILEMKLALDDRRSKSFLQRNKDTAEDPPSSYAVISLFAYFLMGLLYLIPFVTINDMVTAFTISMGMMMFFLAATLISDFTSVLIDVRDNVIILPRPISGKTFLLSRLLHIVIYISKVVIPMSIPSIITLAVMKGVFGLIGYLVTLPFLVLFTIFAVNAIYLLILRLTTPEKFKSLITSIQVVFAIIVYAGYQILPRLMSKAILESYTLPEQLWTMLVPPYWFAALWQVLSTGRSSAFQLIAATVAVLLPLILLWFVIKVFAPSFNRKLGLITGSEGVPSKTSSSVQRSLSVRLSPIFSRNKAEQMGFEFTWALSGRMRDFKLKTYPAFGYILVLIIISLLPRKDFSLERMQEFLSTERFVLVSVLYLSSFFLITALSTSRYTEKAGAAWIFEATPITGPGEIVAGSIRAMTVKFFLPLAVAISISMIALLGAKALPDVLLSIANQLLLTYLTVYFSAMKLPFSLPMNQMEKGTNFLKSLLMLLLIGLVVGIHYATKFLPLSIWFMIPLSALSVFLLDRHIFRAGWKELGN